MHVKALWKHKAVPGGSYLYGVTTHLESLIKPLEFSQKHKHTHLLSEIWHQFQTIRGCSKPTRIKNLLRYHFHVGTQN